MQKPAHVLEATGSTKGLFTVPPSGPLSLHPLNFFKRPLMFGSVSVGARPAPEVLHVGSPLLVGEAALFRGLAGFGCSTRPRGHTRLLNQGGQTRPGRLAVLPLRAMF